MKLYGLFIAIAFLLVGCTTQTTTEVGNFEGSKTITNKFNEEKAAQKRVEAAQVYLQQQNLQRAKFHLDKAAAHMDDYPPLHFTLGFYYEMAQNFEEADASFERAIRLDRDNPEFKNAYARFLCQRGEFRQAEEYFEDAINTPTYTRVDQAYVNAGKCKSLQNDDSAALEYYSRALNLNPKLPTALFEMAQYEFKQQRYARAKQYLERFREVQRHSPKSLWLLLRAESFLGNKDAVSSYALQLQNLYPDSAETLKYLDSREQW